MSAFQATIKTAQVQAFYLDLTQSNQIASLAAFLGEIETRMIWLDEDGNPKGTSPADWLEREIVGDALFFPSTQAIVHNGDYIVKAIDGSIKVYDEEAFDARFEAVQNG
jgi:hypothetical protein